MTCLKLSLAELERRCQEAGQKLTGQRRRVLQVLADAEDHPSVEVIYDRVKALDPTVAMATVYRTLGMLHELGIAMRLEFKENFARYELNWGHHHHLIDIESGAVIEFQDDRIEEMKEKIAADHGYDLVDCVLELYGRKRKTV